METIDKEGYKYHGILEFDKVKEKEMKTELVREYIRRWRLVLRWAVVIMRYGAGVLKWIFDKLKELDRKTQKLLKMHKGLYPKSDVDRLLKKGYKTGKWNKCMDSLLEICLKPQKKKIPCSGWKNVI